MLPIGVVVESKHYNRNPGLPPTHHIGAINPRLPGEDVDVGVAAAINYSPSSCQI